MSLQSVLEKVQNKIKNKDFILREDMKVESLTSGSLLLDNITGGGLLFKGRMTEISGAESSGKTTLCLQSAVSALKNKKQVVFFDFEHTFDIKYSKALGLDMKNPNFAVLRPLTLEEGREALIALESELPDGEAVLIFDSVAAMKPKKLLESGGVQAQIGLMAQRVGELSSYINSVWCGRKKAYVLFTNQIRRVPSAGGVFQAKAMKDSGLGFGTSSDTSLTTTGGSQLRYLLSVRVLLDFAGKIESGSYNDGDLAREGNFIKALVIKNKIRPPFQSVKMAIIYGKGTDDSFAIIQTLKDYEYITQGGSSFTYIDSDENEIGEGLSFKIKGKDAFFDKLKEDKYRKDMEKTFKYIMENQEKAEIVGEDDVLEEDEFDELDD